MKKPAALLMSLLCGFGPAPFAAATDHDIRRGRPPCRPAPPGPPEVYRPASADPIGRVIEKEGAADSAAPADWQAGVEKDIRRAEYELSWQRRGFLDDPPAPGIPDAYEAPNRAQGFRIRFTENGATIAPRDDDAEAGRPQWTWGLPLARFGPAGSTAPVAPASLSVRANRAEYDHGVLSEWFVNDEKGLEQGFTISNPVTVAVDSDTPAAELHLDLAISGNLLAHPAEDRQSIEFRDCHGAKVIRYGELFSHDAHGRPLPSRMEVLAPVGGDGLPARVRIVVDAAGAVYPITIDPLATSPSWVGESDQADAHFGWSVASAGDVNGDGYSDVIVGALGFDNGQTDEGRAFLYFGSASGLAATAAWTAESDQETAYFGASVASAGDVNGDGYSDVIVGAHYFENGQPFEGRAFLYLGSASGLAATPAWTAEGDQAGAEFGFSVASAGDVNSDGYSDVIVGAQQFTNDQWGEGRAFLYLGSASGLAATPAWTAESDQETAEFGVSVASAGDVNGDGYSDVIVGAASFNNGETGEGRAFLYLGGASGLGATPAWTAESDQTGAIFGFSAASAGDVNGDGYSDVIVGAQYFDNPQPYEGRAFLYLGSASGLAATPAWTAESDQEGAYFGYSVASAGDVNGDGFSDVIVGAWQFSNGEVSEGRAFVYLGSASGLAATPAWTAESDQQGARFGTSVASAGDVNGDGYSDVIVGAYEFDNDQASEGRAFLYLFTSISPASATMVSEACAPPNGVIDPGETVTMSFGLQNIDAANTADLVATLLPTGGVTAPSGPQNYGVLVSGGPPVARSFSFTADPAAGCGSTLTATLDLQDGATNLGTVTFGFVLGVLEAAPVTLNFSSGAINVAIADAGTVDVPLNVPTAGGITDINARIRLNHMWDEDLDISLIGPDGTIVDLSSGNGGSGDNYGSGATDCTGTFTLFDDEAATAITAGTPPFNGSFRPEGLLSSFDARASNGSWTLRVTDAAAGYVGNIFCFQLDIGIAQYSCCGGAPGSTDLGVVKTDSPDPVDAGGTLTYSVTAANAGPDNATGVTVTDTLPAGVAFVSAAPSQGGCSQAGGVVTCNLGAMLNGVSATITIVVTAPAVGPLSNSVSIAGAEADPNPVNNSHTETTTVVSVDLGVVKTDSPDPVAAGGTLTYTVTATNAGPDDATGVTVTDTLPAGVAFLSATPSQGSCLQAGGVVPCNLGDISNGGSATVIIVVTAPAVGPLSNSVSISGAEADPNPVNNSDSEATTVTASTDLVVTKTDSPDPVVVGASLTYTVTASNTGPSSATGVTVFDTLPAGVVFVSATPTQGTCSQAGGVVTCNVGALANGASATITIVVTAPSAAGSISNQATISGAENDPDPSDNSDTETTTVTDPCAGETVAPVVTPPASTTVDASICAGNQPGATGNSSAPLAAFIAGGSATDACDTTPTRLPAQVGGVDIDNTTFFPIGTTTVTFRFIDDAGNIGSATADVTVDVFYGDLNEDNLINAGDSVILANYLVGNLAQGVPPFTAPLNAADLNNSASVNSVDSVVLANYLVGNITCLPQ